MNQELPPLRMCPRCRITMQAERSQSLARIYDTFTCLRCDLVLTYKPFESRTAAPPVKREAE